VPHELSTPLTGILEFTDILRTNWDSLPKKSALELLRHIQESGLRLRRLIENNIFCSELFAHAVDPRGPRSSPEEQTENAGRFVLSAARTFAAAHERAVDFNDGSGEVSLPVAPKYLAKTVEELLDNAFKFSGSNSPVTLHTSAVEGSFVIAVTDQGRGMTPEQIAGIGAYVQFDRATHEQQGVGLGLAVVAKIAEMHGGRISISSQAGRGTTATVSFPVAS
jgi:two-component system, sensor histidine kinase and response regulator